MKNIAIAVMFVCIFCLMLLQPAIAGVNVIDGDADLDLDEESIVENEVDQEQSLDIVTLKYDDNKYDTWNSNLKENDYESIMFQMEHPAYLQKLEIMFAKDGEAEIHIWGDGGGNNPDFSNDLTTPIEYTVKPEEEGRWLTFDLADKNISVEPLKYVHFGIKRILGGAGLAVDTSYGQSMSFIYHPDEPGIKYVLQDNANYMIRVEVAYHDKQSTLLFEEIGEIASVSRVAWGDFDNDDDDDMLVSASKLYRNNGDGTFTDISESAGITGIAGSGMWADYNNDGYLDYYAFSSGTTDEDRDRLVHNNGDSTFTAVDSKDRVPFDYDPTQAVAWGDYNHDGWVDLYVANYEVELSQCTPDKLWKNLGGGLFEDVTMKVGIDEANLTYCGRGVAFGDYNNDGLLDLYVSNYRLDPNFLYQNLGDGTFKEVGFKKGLSGENVRGNFGHSIGSVWGDFDNDNDLDLFVGNLAHPRFADFSDPSMLYVNSGEPDFDFENIRDDSKTGITYCETHSDPLWFDYDNDGLLDLMITAIYTEFVSFLYHNNGDNTFENVTYKTGLHVLNGWGVVAVDYDRDGDLDVSTRKFFKNNLANSNHWLEVKLKGKKTNTFGIGCRIKVETDNLTLIREVEGGKGTGVQSSMVQHFGLGTDDKVNKLTVRWVDNTEQVLTDVNVDQFLTVEEDAEPECMNQMGECLSETKLRVCRNWKWTTEDCAEGFICKERFCIDPTVADGDADLDFEGELESEEELEEEIAESEIEPEAAEAAEEEIENEINETIDGDSDENAVDGDETENGGCSKSKGSLPVLFLLLAMLYMRNSKNADISNR